MTARALSDDVARKRISEAIAKAESHTAVEFVVAVRRHASSYRGFVVLGGAAMALLFLSFLLVHPTPFALEVFLVETLLAFLLGTFFVAEVAPLRRLFIPRAVRAARVEADAEATFEALGVARTTHRRGVLLYVALFERVAQLVPDVGLDETLVTAEVSEAVRDLDRAVVAGDLDGLCTALVALGLELSVPHPRDANTRNELSDEVR